jgi:hypothetical protein
MVWRSDETAAFARGWQPLRVSLGAFKWTSIAQLGFASRPATNLRKSPMAVGRDLSGFESLTETAQKHFGRLHEVP